MKLYSSYALASILIAAPLVASHDDDKTAQVQKKSTSQDDEAQSAPVAKKIAQTLWKHKGKVAVGVSVVVLAAIAYWYRASLLYALFNHIDVKDHGKPHSSRMTIKEFKEMLASEEAQGVKTEPVAPMQENNTQTVQPEVQQPSVEKNILDIAAEEMKEVLTSEDEKKLVELANTIVSESPTLAIVENTSDKGIVVLPVLPSTEEVAIASLELIPVVPTTSETPPIIPVQESAQISDVSSETFPSERVPELPIDEQSVHEGLVALAPKENPNGEQPAIDWKNPSSIFEWVRAMNADSWVTMGTPSTAGTVKSADSSDTSSNS